MASIIIDKIGGIDHTEVEIPPGVTVLAGENATNRTSFLQGLMASLGSENVSLKADAEAGRAEIELDGATYTRELTRSGESVLFGGDPYVEGTEATLADLFAFLLESNAARQAIIRRDDLREIIMEPVDTAELEAEIRSLQSERDEIDDQLDHLEDLSARLPDLEERRVELEERIESKRAEVEEVREELESKAVDPETAEQEQRDLENTLEELNDLKSRLRETENAIERTSTQLESYRADREERKRELESLEDVDDAAIEEVASELEDLRDRRERVDEQMETLQNAIRLNSNFLEERSTVFDELSPSEDGGTADITDQLVNDTTVCWTCGQRANRDQIETTVDGLRSLYADRSDERQTLTEEISRLERERSELETAQQRVEATRRALRELEENIEEAKNRLSTLESEKTSVESEISDVEDALEAMRADSHDEITELRTRENELTFDLGQLEADREDLVSEIDSIETRLEERNSLEERREEISESLTELRTRVERLETQAVEGFNEHMATILDRLEYRNIERIWIERKSGGTRGGRSTTTDTFDLHVVRKSEDGAVFQDTVDHLSESEREVTGLVFALAGYLAHDVHEVLPFMVMDSIEALDSHRIDALLGYFEQYTEYLVVALLPEDAANVNSDYTRIESI